MEEEHEDRVMEEEEHEDDDVMESENKKKKKKMKKKRKKIDVTMEIIREHPEKIGPVLGYFPSGLDSDKFPESQVRVFRNRNRSGRSELVVRPQGSRIDFVGTNYDGEAVATQFCNYGLGILDKETQTLKIVPIAGRKIFRLQPKFGDSEDPEELPEEEIDEETVRQNKKDKMKDLNSLYATKRAQTAAKRLETMNRKIDANSAKDLDEKILNVVINKDALESAVQTTTRNVPPHDLTADTPEKAYPLEGIILQSEWYHLDDVMKCVQSGQELSSDTYVRFVCNRAHKLLKIQDNMEKETLAGILSCINHLVKFKDQRDINTKAAVKNHRIPDDLFRKFMTLFTDPGATRLEPPPEKKDLLICYILVLALHADKFMSEVSDIAQDLRMTTSSLRLYYESLGCKLSVVEKKLVAKLPVPLEFPKLSQRSRRGRR